MLKNLYTVILDPLLPPLRANRQALYLRLKNTPPSNLLHEIDLAINSYDIVVVAFVVAWVLRNKVNHIFLDEEITLELYNKLFNLILYSIFVSLKLLY